MIIKNVKLNWTSVVTPNSMSGKYQTDFYLDNPRDLMNTINELWEDHKGSFKGQAQSLGYSETDDGQIKFKASQAPESSDGKYKFEVKVYDAKANQLSDVPNIGNGTKANVDIELYPYVFKNNKGIKINLKAIQILDLVEFGGGSAFEEEEGYTSAEPAFKPEVAGV